MHSRVAVVVVVIVAVVVEVVVVAVIILAVRAIPRHFLVSMCLCLSTCFFLFCLLFVAVSSTSLVCAVRSVSKALQREPIW